MPLSFEKRIDIILILLWTAFATFFQLFLLFPYAAYIPTFLYFVVPTAYLVFKYKPYAPPILWGTLLIGVLMSFPFDLFAQFNVAWVVPFDKVLIPLKLFNFYIVDELIWFALLAHYTLVFYEVFVDGGRRVRLSKNLITALAVWGVASSFSIAAVLFWGRFLLVPLSYLVIVGPFAIPPILYVLYKKPHLLGKFIMPTVFFFFVALNFEIVSITFNHWIFFDDYVGWVSFFGASFPFEEFLYWIVLYPATCLSYYEILVDNGK